MTGSMKTSSPALAGVGSPPGVLSSVAATRTLRGREGAAQASVQRNPSGKERKRRL